MNRSYPRHARGECGEGCGRGAASEAAGFGEHAILLQRVDDPSAALQHAHRRHEALVLVPLDDDGEGARERAPLEPLVRGDGV